MKKTLICALGLTLLTGCSIYSKNAMNKSAATIDKRGDFRTYSCFKRTQGNGVEMEYDENASVEKDVLIGYHTTTYYFLKDSSKYEAICQEQKTKEINVPGYFLMVTCLPEDKSVSVSEDYDMNNLGDEAKAKASIILSYNKEDGTFDHDKWVETATNNGYNCH